MSAENGASAKLHVEYPRTEENGFYVFSHMGSVSYERPPALEYNWGILDEEEKQMATALVEGGKADLFASWGPPGINDQAKRQFFKFMKEQRKKYEGLPVTAFLDTQARKDEVMRLCLASNAPVPNLLAFCERTEDSKKKKKGGRNDYKIVTMKVPFKFSGTTEEVADKASAAFYGGPKALEVEGSALRSKILKQYSRDPSEGIRWMWHPYRCEQGECERADRLQKCGGCQAVYYCSAEHQNEDWARHKVDCKALKSLKVRVLPYRVEEELPQHPINCFQWHILRTADEASFPCEICHRSPFGFSRRFVRAECCGATLCVPKDSKAAHDPAKACNAFHRLSTCFYHWEQRHPGQDWRLCRLCREPRDKEKKKVPFLNNGWEVTPMIDVTKGRLYTDPCATKGCKNRVFVGDPDIKCQDCLKKA